MDANVASPALLAHVAGLNRGVAAALVAHRDAHGPFASREQLREVKGLGPKAFLNAAGEPAGRSGRGPGGRRTRRQRAVSEPRTPLPNRPVPGFLRIRGGDNPLDGTAVHPESYQAAARLVWEVCGSGGQRDVGGEPPRKKARSSKVGRSAKNGGGGGSSGLTAAAIEAARPALAELLSPGGAARLTAAAVRLGIGEPTLRDVVQVCLGWSRRLLLRLQCLQHGANKCPICWPAACTACAKALLAPERDVRGEAGLQTLQFRQAMPLAQLRPGMELTGVVRNVAAFGAFVDINCEVDGLVHVSEFARTNGGGQSKSSQQQQQQADIHDIHASVGDLLRLRVVSVDPQRRRISLAPLA